MRGASKNKAAVAEEANKSLLAKPTMRQSAILAVENAISKVEFSAVFVLTLKGKRNNDFDAVATAARVNAKQPLEPPDKSMLNQAVRRSPLLDDNQKSEAILALKCCTTKAEVFGVVKSLVGETSVDDMWKALSEARRLLADLRSPWQMLKDPGGRPYFYNSKSGETLWEDPPRIKHETPEDGFCERCRREKAVRDCHDCRLSYCFGCFAMVHHPAQKPAHDKAGHVPLDDPTEHDVTPVEYKLPPPFGCSVCAQELASMTCHQCEKHYCSWCYWDAHARGEMADHSYTEFVAGSAVCLECEEKLADRECEQCGDKMCEGCARKTHTKGRKAHHTWKEIFFVLKDELGYFDEYCTECDQRKATRVCDQCGDNYCDACYRRTHAKGRRAQHTYQTWGAAQTDWEEFWDESKNKYVYYNPVTKASSEEKPVELLWGKEKQMYLEAKEKEEKEKWEKSELKRLQDKVAVLEMQNKELSVRKPGFMAKMGGKALSGAKSGFRRASQAIAPSLFDEDGNRKKKKKKKKGDGEEDSEEDSDEDSDDEDDEEAQLRKQARERKRRMLRLVKPNSTLVGEIKKNPKAFASNPVRFTKDFTYLKREQDARYLRKMMIGKEKDADDRVQERKKFEKALLEELSEKQDEKRKVMLKDLVQEKKDLKNANKNEKAWHEDLLAE